MPVNLQSPVSSALLPVKGVLLGTAEASIKKPGRKDLLLMHLAAQATVAGVFTQNRFCAAPVITARLLSSAARLRAHAGQCFLQPAQPT